MVAVVWALVWVLVWVEDEGLVGDPLKIGGNRGNVPGRYGRPWKP